MMSPFDAAWNLLKSSSISKGVEIEWGPHPETGEFSPVSTHPAPPAPPPEPSIGNLVEGNVPMGQLGQLSPEELAILRLRGHLPPHERHTPQQIETAAMAPDLPPGQGQLPRGPAPTWTAEALAQQHARCRPSYLGE